MNAWHRCAQPGNVVIQRMAISLHGHASPSHHGPPRTSRIAADLRVFPTPRHCAKAQIVKRIRLCDATRQNSSLAPWAKLCHPLHPFVQYGTGTRCRAAGIPGPIALLCEINHSNITLGSQSGCFGTWVVAMRTCRNRNYDARANSAGQDEATPVFEVATRTWHLDFFRFIRWQNNLMDRHGQRATRS